MVHDAATIFAFDLWIWKNRYWDTVGYEADDFYHASLRPKLKIHK